MLTTKQLKRYHRMKSSDAVNSCVRQLGQERPVQTVRDYKIISKILATMAPGRVVQKLAALYLVSDGAPGHRTSLRAATDKHRTAACEASEHERPTLGTPRQNPMNTSDGALDRPLVMPTRTRD